MTASRNTTDRITVSTVVFLEASLPFRARRPIPPKTSAGIRRTLIRPQRGCTTVDIRSTIKRKQRNDRIAIVNGKRAYLFLIDFYTSIKKVTKQVIIMTGHLIIFTICFYSHIIIAIIECQYEFIEKQ